MYEPLVTTDILMKVLKILKKKKEKKGNKLHFGLYVVGIMIFVKQHKVDKFSPNNYLNTVICHSLSLYKFNSLVKEGL